MSMKFCYYTVPYPNVKSFHDMIDRAAEHGLPGVEGFCRDELAQPDKDAARELKKYADERGIVFPCFSLYIDMVGEDAEEKMKYLKGYAEVAAILECPYLHHTVIPEHNNPAKVLPRYDELFEKGIKVVQEIYDYAAPLGVRPIYEDQGYIFNGTEGFGKFLDAVGRNVGVVADFGNIAQADQTIADFIPAFKDKIVHAHLKDVINTDVPENGLKTLSGQYMHNTVFGEGGVPLKEGLTLLKEIGYDGDLAYETNQVGIDEFQGFAKSVDAEVMMAVNLGTRGAAEAGNLVEYCNADTDTYYANGTYTYGRMLITGNWENEQVGLSAVNGATDQMGIQGIWGTNKL